MKIAILGFGREGKAIFNFLKKSKEYKKSQIWILDKNQYIQIPAGAKSQIGKNYLKNLEKFDIVFRSPGVPYNLTEIKIAKQKGVKITSVTKFFLEKAKDRAKLIIGVTGTKGKSTTSALIYKVLKNAKKNVLLAGNMGRPAINYLNKINKNTIIVLELSSFQLQDLKNSPQIAIVLDIFPDHQDTHRSMKEYLEAKSNICRYQSKNNVVFYFKNIYLSMKVAQAGDGKKIGVDENKIKVFEPNGLKIKGWHSFRNACMVYYVAKYLKIPDKIILKTLKSFKGLEHRLEFVRKIKVANNQVILFYNDSASSNPNSSKSAILSFPNKHKIIILGGRDKNLNYQPLALTLKKIKKEIVCFLIFGENKLKILSTLLKNKVKSSIKLALNLKEIVKLSKKEAQNFLFKNKNAKEVIVIFSPGATSFDMFQNYDDRGREFKKLILNL